VNASVDHLTAFSSRSRHSHHSYGPGDRETHAERAHKARRPEEQELCRLRKPKSAVGERKVCEGRIRVAAQGWNNGQLCHLHLLAVRGTSSWIWSAYQVRRVCIMQNKLDRGHTVSYVQSRWTLGLKIRSSACKYVTAERTRDMSLIMYGK
jgi:hypothetical protein